LIFFPIKGLVSLLGNGLAVHVFRRKGHEITVPEFLLLNIAVVDILLSGATYPAPIVAAFSHRWIFGELGTGIIMIMINQCIQNESYYSNGGII